MQLYLRFIGGLFLACLSFTCGSNESANEVEDSVLSRSGSAFSPEVLSSHTPYLPDFSYAGYENGLVALPEPKGQVFDVTDYGAAPDDGLDDSKAALKALAAASEHEGPVILHFPTGRFILSDILYLERSDFTLRGVGEETILYYPRPLRYLPTPPAFRELSEYLLKFDKRQREPENNLDQPFSLYAWSGGYLWTQTPNARGKAYLEAYDDFPEPLAGITAGKRGELTVTVDEAGSLKIGDVLKIEWYNREGEDGSLLREMYGDPTKIKKIGSHHWNFPRRALVSQITKITAIAGKQIILADPLLLNADPRWQPKLVPWPHLERVFIRDFRVEFPNGIRVAHHVEDGFNAMYLTNLYDSYVHNVRITNADSGILTEDDGNLTIQNVTTDGDHYAHYSVAMGSVYNTLARNIRVENRVEHPLSFNTYSVKCVYTECEVLQKPVLDQHSGGNHQNLFDHIRVHVQLGEGENSYPLMTGGGAGYWKPTHGRFSSFYNIDVQFTGGANGAVTLIGPEDGPQARLIGIHGNREVKVAYGPDAYVEGLNLVPEVKSLYEYQKRRRE